MAKWADYCISAVRYDDDHDHIIELNVHPDNGDTIGSSSVWTRQQVVSAIGTGSTFVTIIRKDGSWNRGSDVHVVTVNGVKYLRTDGNSTARDNLGSLPEF